MNKKILVIVLVMIASVLGYIRYTVYAQQQGELEKVKAGLKDPASAQFRNVKYNNGKASVCGEINSKNSFGGYTGFGRFCMYLGEYVLFEGAIDFENKGSRFWMAKRVAHLEVTKQVLERLKKGDSSNSSESDMEVASDKLAFNNLYKELCE